MEISLYWEERGNGTPLVLLHGNGEDGTYFARQMEEFSRDFRVLAVDTRGHGRSPRGTAPFTLDQFAEDLKDFLDGRGIARAAILGFSDGGNIALLFALRYPSCVEKLIVNGANLYPSGMKTGVWLATELEYEFLRLLSVFSPGAAKKRDLFRLMAREPHIRWESLQKIAVPALVIAGTDDMIKESHTRRMAAALPRGELALIEGSHFVARENSQEFNRAVRNRQFPGGRRLLFPDAGGGCAEHGGCDEGEGV